MEPSPLRPVFARRGPVEQVVTFRITDLAADVDFSGDEVHRPWSSSFEWTWVQEVVIDAKPEGTILVIDGNLFRLPEIAVGQLRKLIDPLRLKVGTSHSQVDPTALTSADGGQERRSTCAPAYSLASARPRGGSSPASIDCSWSVS